MTHIASYTTKDLATDINRVCKNDPGDESTIRVERAINAAITAAVQAEREACAKVADTFEVEAAYRLKNHAVTADAKQQRTAQMDASSNIAAAIRARSNGSGRK